MAIDWTIPREATYRFVRVDYATRVELEELTTIEAGGDITRNLLDLKEEGSLSCVNPPTLGDDLIRIYCDAKDADGTEETVTLATMHAVKAKATYSAATQRVRLKLMSALLTLEQARLDAALSIASGANAITSAVTNIEALGLPVVSTPSARTLTVKADFVAGDSYLKVVNYLLDFAGYWSAKVDTYGRVWLDPYQDPIEREPAWVFVDGENCTYLPDVTTESDAFDIPNICLLTASNAEGTLTGVYENDDPASPYSTATRGRDIVLVETITDAVDQTDIDAKAKKRLLEKTVTETYTVRHAYAPVTVGDCVTFAWSTHGLSVRATIQSQSLELGPALMVTSVLKRVGL